jgi:hypothetical protein
MLMVKRWSFGLLLLGAIGAGFAGLAVPESRQSGTHQSKRVIGQTAWVEIPEADLGFLGRVDTGAESTSVHAESIRRDGGEVEFELVNRLGKRVRMRVPLAKTDVVRNAVGREKRMYVDLTIRHEGMNKRVRANLNDRSGLNYSLLLGRDWLQDDFMVDVAREPVGPPDSWDERRLVAEESRGMASR